MSAGLFAVRSVLFLPASNPRAIAKARDSDADMVILDLEDSVKPDDKEAARTAAVEAVNATWRMPVAIRLNGAGTSWHEADVAAVAQSGGAYAVLPRVKSAAEARALANGVAKPLMAMIETATGVLQAPDIAVHVAALIAGTNDLAADLKVPPSAGRQSMQVALQSIVLAARASGIAAFDGVFNGLSDPEGLAAECEEGRSLGFDGKTLIHPNQIEACNRIFAPSAEEIEEARKLIAAFTGGAERHQDRMIERMHVEAARRTLTRAGDPRN